MTTRKSLLSNSVLAAALLIGGPLVLAACDESTPVVIDNSADVFDPTAPVALTDLVLPDTVLVIPFFEGTSAVAEGSINAETGEITIASTDGGAFEITFDVNDSSEVSVSGNTLLIALPASITPGSYVVTAPSGLVSDDALNLSTAISSTFNIFPAIAPSPSPTPTPTPAPAGTITLSAEVPAQTSASAIQIVIVGGGLDEATVIVLPESTIDYEFTFNEGADQVFTSGLDDLFDATTAFSTLEIEGIAAGTEVIVRDLDGNILATGTAE